MVIKKNMASLWQSFINFFTKGHQRSLEAKKNIVGSLIVKALSIGVSLILVPLTIHYINPTKNGIWLTISSVIGWMSFFDIGFTHGLRNKFAQAKAKGNIEIAKIYVSTTYYYVSIIFLSLWLLLLAVNQFISWHKFLNLSPNDEAEVSRLAMLIFTYFCFQFIFRIISTILIADQQSAKASLIDMLGQLLTLVIVYFLTKTTQGSLIYLGLAAGVAPLLVMVVANIFFFNTRYKQYKPSLKFVRKEYAKDIMKLGGKFFVLQIAAIIQFETTLVLITKFFGAAKATDYNIAYRYFAVLNMGFSILLSPLWSGVTEAYNTNDIAWIKNAVKKYLRIVIIFIVGGFIMLLISGKVYKIWIRDENVKIDFLLSLLCYIFFCAGMFASIFVYVINGIGALKIQFYCAIAASFIFVLLSFLFVKQFNWGVQSIIAASVITNVFGYVIAPLQVYKVFYQKSKNPIWYK